MRFVTKSMLAGAVLLSLSACEVAKESNARVIESRVIRIETVIDPETGTVAKLTHWEYDDGGTVVTEDRFKKDTPVEQRRATSRAPIRTVEIP